MKRSRRPLPRIARDLPVYQRKPNERLRPKHLQFIRALRCCRCGAPGPCEAAHVRLASDGGASLRPSDRFTVPLCAWCHRLATDAQHAGEATFWAELQIDPLDLALRLWTITGDLDQGNRAVFRQLQLIELHVGEARFREFRRRA